jgi:hypothetical protein
MNSFTKTASAVALAVGLAAPFSAEAGGEYYPYGAYRARHGEITITAIMVVATAAIRRGLSRALLRVLY